MNRYAVVAAALLLALMVVGVGAIVVVSPFPPPAPTPTPEPILEPAPDPVTTYTCSECGHTWTTHKDLVGWRCPECGHNPSLVGKPTPAPPPHSRIVPWPGDDGRLVTTPVISPEPRPSLINLILEFLQVSGGMIR